MSVVITWDGDTDPTIDQDEKDIVDTTMDDAAQLATDEMLLVADQQALTDALANPALGTDEGLTYLVMVVFPLMLTVMEDQILIESDMMLLSSDLMNDMLYSQDHFNAMCSGANQGASYTDADGQADAQAMIDSMNVLLGTDTYDSASVFHISYYNADGTPMTYQTTDAQGHEVTATMSYTANGLLDLLSNPSYWPLGTPPMSTQDAATISGWADNVESCFSGTWGSPSAMYKEVQSWVVPTTDINTESANQEDQVNSAYSGMIASSQQQYQKMQMQLETMMSLYQEDLDSMNQCASSLSSMQQTMVNNLGA